MSDNFYKKVSSLHSCKTHHECSFFELIDVLLGKERTGPRSPMHRFCTLMRKMKAESFVEEDLFLDFPTQEDESLGRSPNLSEEVFLYEELHKEREAIRRRCDSENVGFKIKRITFFSCEPLLEIEDIPSQSILGFAVIITLDLPNGKRRTYLHEAVVKIPSIRAPFEEEENFFIPISNYYFHSVREFKTCIGTESKYKEFIIKGSFFAQQNNLTSVCAHAALRMAINSSPFNFSGLKEKKLTNIRINKILGIDFLNPKKLIGSYQKDTDLLSQKKGLTYDEMEEVVKELGGHVVQVKFKRDVSIEYDRFLYHLIESNFPTLLGIEGWHVTEAHEIVHVVAVLGHTVNTDRWIEAHKGYGAYPVQKYLPVIEWCDHLLISDDNFGPYFTLPTSVLRNFIVPQKNPNFHASVGFGIYPRNINLPGYEAEQYAVTTVNNLLNFYGGPFFKKEDFKSFEILLDKIIRSTDDLSVHLKSRLSRIINENNFAKFKHEIILQHFIIVLNKLLISDESDERALQNKIFDLPLLEEEEKHNKDLFLRENNYSCLTRFYIERIYPDFIKKSFFLDFPPRVRFWLSKLNEKKDSIVFRTLYQDKKDYIGYLNSLAGENDILPEQTKEINKLEDTLWVSEFTLPDLYIGNKTKLGDIVIPTNLTQEVKNEKERPFLLAWLPGIIQFKLPKPLQPWFVKDHVPIIRSDKPHWTEW